MNRGFKLSTDYQLRTEVQAINIGCWLANEATPDVLKKKEKLYRANFARKSACTNLEGWEIFCSVVFHIQLDLPGSEVA